MAVKKLIQPKHLNIDIKPSPRQYELWKCLQPECPDCGGEVKNTFIGIDEHGNRKFVPECSGCGSRNIPQMILGGGAAGGGKGMKLTDSILTPYGFRELGGLSAGDKIISATTGGMQTIKFMHPIEERDYYRVHFIDGTYTDCSDNHLWQLHQSKKRSKRTNEDGEQMKERLWYATEMFEWMNRKKEGMYKGCHLIIPLCAPVKFAIGNPTQRRALIDPYVLGALIGDGCFGKSYMDANAVGLASADQEIVDRFIAAGIDMSRCYNVSNGSKCNSYIIKDKGVIEAVKKLGLAGHLAIDKFIPERFKYSSIEERKELLQGLCDTDGYVDDRGHMSYTSISSRLAEDVAFVVRSLGGKATITKGEASYKDDEGNKVICNDAYTVYIMTKFDPELVNLKRKKDRCRYEFNGGNSELGKRIIDIEYIGKHVGRCITVDEPSGLFVTDNFTVTHNSYIGSTWLCSSCIRFPNLRMGLVRKQLKDIKNSTLVTIKKVLTGWGLIEDVNYSINNLTNIISFWNGSEILMMELADLPSDADFSRIGSLELSGVMVEEGSEISERAADTIFSRIRWQLDKSFKVPKMFIGTNPAPCWLRNRFVQDDEGNPVECRDNERFIRFSVWDNPDDEFRRTYEASLNRIKDNATRERLLYGNWDFSEPNSMAIYNKFNGDRHLESDVKGKYYNPLKPVIVSVDFNVAPHMSSIVSQIDYENKRVYIFSEVLGLPKDKENNTPAFAKKLKKYLIDWKHMGGVNITGDPSGKQRSTTSEDGVNNYTIISDALGENALRPTIKLFRKQPPQKTRCEFVNDLFDFYDGWSIIIDKNCRRLIEDLIFQPKNEDGTKSKKKVTDPKTQTKYEKYGHLSDCLDYLLCFFLKESYNTFISGNEDIDKIASVPAAYTGFNY